MRLAVFIAFMILCTACASAKIEDGVPTLHVFGKAEASVTCVTVTEPEKSHTCEAKVKGEGLTENAVGLLTKILELPGALLRGVGGALP